jgi:hypothetical protein
MGNAFCYREAVSPIKVIIWNEELLTGLETYLLEQIHMYVSLAAIY